MGLDDIQALLEDTDEQLALVSSLHEESAESGVMSRRFKPRIKNVVENQRSVLDYLAYEVHQRHGQPTKAKIYYPFSTDPEKFDADIDNRMPGVRSARGDVAEAIKRHQPFAQEWMRWLAQLRNENGHRALTKHVAGQETRTELRTTDGGIATIQGIGFFRNGTRVHPSAVTTGWTSYTDVPITVWSFADPPIPVPNALWQIQSGVRSALSDIAQGAGL